MDAAYTAYAAQCAVVGAAPMSSNAYRAMTRMGRNEGYHVYTSECQTGSIAPMSFVTWCNSIDNVFPPPVQDQHDDAEAEEYQEDPQSPTVDAEESEDPAPSE